MGSFFPPPAPESGGTLTLAPATRDTARIFTHTANMAALIFQQGDGVDPPKYKSDLENGARTALGVAEPAPP